MSADTLPDRRQDRTRTAIRQAFLALMFDTNYADITVAAVAARANVGRSTLYEHFRTKTDLLRDALIMPMSALAAVVAAPDVPPMLIGWLQHFRERQALGRVLFYLPARDVMLSVLADLIEARLETTATPTVLPRKLLAAQIAAAQFAVLTPWILGQVAVPYDAMARGLYRSSNALAQAGMAA